MLSRFAFRGKHLVKCSIVRPQSSTSASVATPTKTAACNTDQRDYVNFPEPVRAEYAPPVKFGVIPASWFEAFYPKTGVTGPYVFLTGLVTYCLSKEVFILEHHAANLVSVVLLFSFIHYKFGDRIAEFYTKLFQKQCDELDSIQQKAIERAKIDVENIKKALYPEEFIEEVSKLKKEIVYFQMEAIYRERLAEVYDKIKRSLDYQAAVENVDKSFVQKNLIDYVIRNVLSSITPEKEKMVLDKCISDLATLADKA